MTAEEPDAAVRLSVRGVTKVFGSNVALRDVSFDVGAGEVVGLLGENGAGKSTLIKILAGLYRPDAGSISVDGVELALASPQHSREHGLRFVHQRSTLIDSMTIAENIGLVCGFRGRPGIIDAGAHEEATAALMAEMRIPGHPTDLVGDLPAPVRTMVSLSAALADNSRVVVLDEPTASLTARESRSLFERVDTLRRSGRAVILVTHRIDEVLEHCQRVVVLRDGQLVAERSVADVNKQVLFDLIVGSSVKLGQSTPRPRHAEPVLTIDGLRLASHPPVSFDVGAGEILGLAGPVGAAQELIPSALFGLTPRRGGRCTLVGRPYEPKHPQHAIAAGVAYVPADRHAHGLAGRMTARENLYLNPAMRPQVARRGGGERRAAKVALQRFAVRPSDTEAELDTFSGGNAQKILLARWLSQSPHVAILCEPTAGVDVGARAGIYGLIREMAQSGTAFLVVSSDFDELSHLCTRTIVFAADGATTEFDAPCDVAELTVAALR